jgi:hypothetical protein
LKESSKRNETNSSLKSSRTFTELLLSATAAIFVQDQEVIAMASSGGSIIAMEGRMEETTAGEPSLANQEHVSAVGFDFDGDDDGDSGNLAFRISRIATMMNPRKEDKHKFPSGSHCLVLDSGKSHYRLYGDDKKAWARFLKIP